MTDDKDWVMLGAIIGIAVAVLVFYRVLMAVLG